jgi:hypothetical protein
MQSKQYAVKPNMIVLSQIFYEINNVKNILLQQILDSIGTKYLDTFTNEYTRQLNTDIPAIFTYKFNNYAKAVQGDVNE